MIKYKFFFFILIFLFSNSLFANNIGTINIEYILKNNDEYNKFLKSLNAESEQFKNKLSIFEQKILNEKTSITNEKLFLSEVEYNERVSKYNLSLQEFDKKIKNFDNFLSANLDRNKNALINKIIEMSKKLSVEKGYDLIFSENNYFISSNSIDISDLIINNLNPIKLNLRMYTQEELF